jgi:hypothetical protein
VHQSTCSYLVPCEKKNGLSQCRGVVLTTRTLRYEGDGGVPAGRPSITPGEVIERVHNHTPEKLIELDAMGRSSSTHQKKDQCHHQNEAE